MLKHDRRVVTGATVQARMKDEGGKMKAEARFEYAIGDSVGVTRLGGGEYSLEATGLASAAPVGQHGAGRTLRATVGFRIEVPFFLDDSAYSHRVEQLVYVAGTDEMRHLRSVQRGERQQAWREFWMKREKSPIRQMPPMV